jgi:hypothetical protein
MEQVSSPYCSQQLREEARAFSHGAYPQVSSLQRLRYTQITFQVSIKELQVGYAAEIFIRGSRWLDSC